MIKFEKEKVLLLHKLITEETGGDYGIRDMGLLESALESVFATFDGKDLYPTKEEKAARLGFNLVNNHAFLDGNKRIGIYVMISFLEVNGIKMDCTNEDLIDLGFGIAENRYKYEDILNWIHKHKA